MISIVKFELSQCQEGRKNWSNQYTQPKRWILLCKSKRYYADGHQQEKVLLPSPPNIYTKPNAYTYSLKDEMCNNGVGCWAARVCFSRLYICWINKTEMCDYARVYTHIGIYCVFVDRYYTHNNNKQTYQRADRTGAHVSLVNKHACDDNDDDARWTNSRVLNALLCTLSTC